MAKRLEMKGALASLLAVSLVCCTLRTVLYDGPVCGVARRDYFRFINLTMRSCCSSLLGTASPLDIDSFILNPESVIILFQVYLGGNFHAPVLIPDPECYPLVYPPVPRNTLFSPILSGYRRRRPATSVNKSDRPRAASEGFRRARCLGRLLRFPATMRLQERLD